jgi:hypothetical protein
LPLEVIAAVREAVGPHVPLLYRLSADEHVDGGLTLSPGTLETRRGRLRILLLNLTLIDGSGAPPVAGAWIVVEDDRIAEVHAGARPSGRFDATIDRGVGWERCHRSAR